jgi:hypothetical protein
MKQVRGGIIGVIFFATWFSATFVTYGVNIVNTWNGGGNLLIKIINSLTLDVFIATIWPYKWAYFLITHF